VIAIIVLFAERFLCFFKKQSSCLPPDFTLVSSSAYFSDPEDGGDLFLRNVG
jgi:hypothetical protein